MKEEIHDFIFGIIKINKEIDFSSILKKYKTELEYYSITEDFLVNILNELISDKIIYQDTNTVYKVCPTANDFKGYVINKLQDDVKNRKIKKRNFQLRIIPIYAAIFFGITTIIFKSLNYSNNKDNIKKKAVIDSLYMEIALYKSRIDSFENSLKEPLIFDDTCMSSNKVE